MLRFVRRLFDGKREIAHQQDQAQTDFNVTPRFSRSGEADDAASPPLPLQAIGERPRYGLTRLRSDEHSGNSTSAERAFPVDVVALHGLGGDAYKTFTHENGTFWLEDLLPDLLPGARIYTYGYAAKSFFSNSLGEVYDFSLGLLVELSYARVSDEEKSRPIIFLCHSLGGIVCKKALLIAHEQTRYNAILDKTSAIMFFGTPHRGAAPGLAGFGAIAARVINKLVSVTLTGGLAGISRSDLLKQLRSNSKELAGISQAFRDRAMALEIVSIFETWLQPPIFSMIVKRHSATLDVPNEEAIPMDAHHRGLCRFPGAACERFRLVKDPLLRLATNASQSARYRRT